MSSPTRQSPPRRSPKSAGAGPSFLLLFGALATGLGLLIAAIRFGPGLLSSRPPEPSAPPAASQPATPASPPAVAAAPPAPRVANPPKRALLRPPPPAPPTPDPLFDFDAIINTPLDAVVTKSTTKDGLVTEEFEYTSFIDDGKPDRVAGLLVRPVDGTAKVPGVLWCQSGMYAASPEFPTMFARKGYVGLCVTLPVNRRNPALAFDTADPRCANLTLLAIDQMRAISYLTQRPEVDGERVFAIGSSYGGFFAALLAGADPRVCGGAAFFGAGHQALGTNIPQFTGMKSTSDVEAWNRLIDPAYRLKQRAVPFLFTCPSNDNWFFPPSVVQSFVDAKGDCRLAIVPHWQHGFPPHIDQQIVDFADVVLAGARVPYNKPGPIKIETRDGKAIARWSWTGGNRVKRAELVVSYGPAHPWHYWLFRHHQIMPATIDGQTASVELPVPFKGAQAYVYGNIIDEHDVLTSAVPVAFDAAAAGVTSFRTDLAINGVTFGDFEPESVGFLKALGEISGEADAAVKHAGSQSVRLDPLAGPKAGAQSIRYKLCWTPGQSHRLKVWLRSAAPAKLTVSLEPASPAQWISPLVVELARRERPQATPPSRAQITPLVKTIDAGEEWTQVTIDAPAPGPDVDGYHVRIIGDAAQKTPFWIDDLSFETIWPTAP